MVRELTIGDRDLSGTLEIIDTHWDSNGTLSVTVRDISESGRDNTAAMRRLARRAIAKPELTRSSRVVRRFRAMGNCPCITFAVSRLD